MQTRGATPSAPSGNTHAPGPGGMPTGCSRYLRPWPLCTVCAKKGVDNLLNRTLPEAGTSGSTKQVWGLLAQDSIYGRLRRLCILCMVISTIIFHTSDTNHHSSYPFMPHWPFSLQRDVSTKLVSPWDRSFSGFLPVGMKGIRGWILSQVFKFQQQGILIMHL